MDRIHTSLLVDTVLPRSGEDQAQKDYSVFDGMGSSLQALPFSEMHGSGNGHGRGQQDTSRSEDKTQDKAEAPEEF
jgi:hypothetical protein